MFLRKVTLTALGIASVSFAISAQSSTQFILRRSDTYNTSSFSTPGNWVTNGTANPATTPPAPGGVYDTGPYTLRTPTSGAYLTFGGDSLTLSAGAPAASGSLMLKGPDGATVVINNLILAGGVLSQGVNTGPNGIQWVAGTMTVISNSSVSGLDQPTRFIGIASTISGAASLSNDCSVVYSGNNASFTGPITVGNGGSIRITDQVNLGGNPPGFNPAQLLLNNGTLAACNTLTLNAPQRGITLAGGGGVFTNFTGTTLTISNVITGPGALTFAGAGNLVLAATNTYTGATTINGGRLSLLCPKPGTGNISLANGATLAIAVSATPVTPAALALGTSAAVTLQFMGVSNTATAPLAAGSLSTGGTVVINVSSGTFSVGQSYPLLTWTSGAAPPVTLGVLIGAGGNLTTNGNAIRLNITSDEPGPTASVKFEAESGTLGSEFAISNGSPIYITTTTDGGGFSPGSEARVATYTVAFPAAGTYQLYARVRVGPGTYDDDSLFYGNGFGVKNPTNDADWILVNSLAGVGFTAGTAIVTGGGAAGSGVWKWINLTQFAPGPSFAVDAASLVQTFQIGARENGLDIDAFVFGLNGMTFTVNDLNAGVDGTPPVAGATTVNWTDVRQRIDGFGGGVVFLVPGSLDPVSDANMDALFGTNAAQLGLTLLRVRIDPNGNWANALADGQKAAARGAGVIATPWTPPASMKDNASLIGGSLLPAQYANYANFLNNFAGYMKSNGAPLAAVSVQNEPDVTVDYESCDWTAGEFVTFFRNNAGAITNAPVMMPESFFFDPSMSEPTLNDPAAVTNVSIVGGHLYGATIADCPNAHSKGIPTWMTEYLVNDQTIGSAITTAEQIQDCLTIGNMSAYVWWKVLGDANGLVNASGIPQKRGFVLAQFSRFVRPGFHRIGTVNNDALSVTAFRNTNSARFAIIAVNPTSFPLSPSFNCQSLPAVTAVTPWLTSPEVSLAAQPSVALTNSTFTYILPGMSIVTFVGQATVGPPSQPVFTSIAAGTGQMTLTATGALGSDYLLFSSTNLVDWELLATTNPAAMPVSFVDTNPNDAARFYRLQLGP